MPYSLAPPHATRRSSRVSDSGVERSHPRIALLRIQGFGVTIRKSPGCVPDIVTTGEFGTETGAVPSDRASFCRGCVVGRHGCRQAFERYRRRHRRGRRPFPAKPPNHPPASNPASAPAATSVILVKLASQTGQIGQIGQTGQTCQSDWSKLPPAKPPNPPPASNPASAPAAGGHTLSHRKYYSREQEAGYYPADPPPSLPNAFYGGAKCCPVLCYRRANCRPMMSNPTSAPAAGGFLLPNK